MTGEIIRIFTHSKRKNLATESCSQEHATYQDQESGRETAKERNGAKQENPATLQAAYLSASISGSASSHFPETVQKSFKLSGAQGELPQEEPAPR